MKSRCSFVLKTLTALVLVFLLLFGTVATPLAAVVDEADSGAMINDLAETGGWNYSGKKLFIKPEGNWKLNNEKYRLHYWGDNSLDRYTDVAVAVAGTAYYYVTLPDVSCNGAQWVRVDGSSIGNVWNWGANWDGTSNAYWDNGTSNSQYTVIDNGTTVYFDAVDSDWDDDKSIFTEYSNSDKTRGNPATKIADQLYKYTLDAFWDCPLYWWNGDASDDLDTPTHSITGFEIDFQGKNAIIDSGTAVADGGTPGTVAFTNLTQPIITGNSTIYEGDTFTVTVTNSSSIKLNYTADSTPKQTTPIDLEYTYYVDDVAVGAATSSTSCTIPAAKLAQGSRSIKVTVSSALLGLESTSAVTTLTVNPPACSPVIKNSAGSAALADTSIYAHQTLSFMTDDPSGHTATYTVQKDSASVTASDYLGSCSGLADRTLVTFNPNGQTGEFVITSSCSGGGSDSVTITVNAEPDVFFKRGGSTAIQAGEDGDDSTQMEYDPTASATLGLADHVVYSLKNYSFGSTDATYWAIYNGTSNISYNTAITSSTANAKFGQAGITTTGISASSSTITPAGSKDHYNLYYDLKTDTFYIEYPVDVNYYYVKSDDLANPVLYETDYVAYNTDASTKTVTVPGYTMANANWYSDAGCTYGYTFTSNPVTSSKNLYKPVTLNTGVAYAAAYTNGSASATGGTVQLGSSAAGANATLSALSIHASGALSLTAAVTSAGYRFDGWTVDGAMASAIQIYKNSACTVAYDYASDGGNVATVYIKTDGSAGITVDNAIVKANFTANTYAVTFNANKGTLGATPSQTATFDADMPTVSSATMPVRKGFALQGLFDATSGGTKYYNADGTSARTWNKSSAATLYAQWAPNNFYAAKAGMNIYLDITRYDVYEGVVDEDNVIQYRFSNGTGYHSEGWVDAGTCSDRNGNAISGLFYSTVPADGYNFVQFRLHDTTVEGTDTFETKLYAIIDPSTNTLVISDSGVWNDELNLPWNDEPAKKVLPDEGKSLGHIYFDNSITRWNVTETESIYFVIGRDDYQAVYKMNLVSGTDNLYYLAPRYWSNYTYFGFALIEDEITAPALTGGYHPTNAEHGVLNQADAYTTFMSMYDLARLDSTNNYKNKSFIGFGLSQDIYPALDFLWITDNGASKVADGEHAEDYLNRRQQFTISGGKATVSVSGYKAIEAGNNNTSTTFSTDIVSSSKATGATGTVLALRTSTVNFTVTPADGYAITEGGVRLNGSTSGLTDTNNGDGSHTYTYKVVGADDNVLPENLITQIAVSLTPDDKTIHISQEYNNGSGYTADVTGGTLSIRNDTTSTNLVDSGSGVTVKYDDELTLTATPAENYSVVGIYISTDNSTWNRIDGITSTNVGARVTSMLKDTQLVDDNYYFKALFISHNTVTVANGLDAFVSINSGDSRTRTFNVGANVVVNFGNLPGSTGISSVNYADGCAPASDSISGHIVSFTMPNHAVTIESLNNLAYDAMVTIDFGPDNVNKVDVAGISSTHGYYIGDDVGTITISGSSEYSSANELVSLTAVIGETSVTVAADNDGDSEDDITETIPITIGETIHTLTVTYHESTETVTISGHIGGPLTLTPICAVSYNLNITNKVLSDLKGGAKRLNNYVDYYDSGTSSYVGVKLGEVSATVTPYGGSADTLVPDGEGDYIDSFSSTDTITLSSSINENLKDYYTFLGWYEGTSYGPTNRLSNNEGSYSFSPTKSTFIYAVYTRDVYIGGQKELFGELANSYSDNHKPMDFDTVNGVYYKDITTAFLDKGSDYYFAIFDLATGGAEDSNYRWLHGQTSPVEIEGVSLAKDGGDYTSYKINVTNNDAYDWPVRINYNPVTQKVFAVPTYNYKTIYLTTGMADKYATTFTGLGAVSAVSSFSDLEVGKFDTPAALSSQPSKEQCTSVHLTDPSEHPSGSLKVSTQVGLDYEVVGWVLYDLDAKTKSTYIAVDGDATADVPDSEDPGAEIVAHKYTSPSFPVTSSMLIVPVIEISSGAMARLSLTSKKVTVDASKVNRGVWGGMVAMYVFSGENPYNASWPGQLMIPAGDTYTANLYMKDGISVSGIVFTNYRDASDDNFISKYGYRFMYPSPAQTYDYREPVSMIESGGDYTLTCSLKTNNDGYHGSFFNSVGGAWDKSSLYRLDVSGDATNGSKETVLGYAYKYSDKEIPAEEDWEGLTDSYNFDYLTNASGERLNLNGEEIGTNPVGYYVVCVGDYYYGGDLRYPGDTSYNGHYSVQWHVYDGNFIYLGQVLSAGIYDYAAGSTDTILYETLSDNLDIVRAVLSNPSYDLDLTKSIKICYEAPNTRRDYATDLGTTRFSAQWYKKSNNVDITATVKIGTMTSNNVFYPTDRNTSSDGEAQVAEDSISVKSNTVTIKLSKGQVYLTTTDAENFGGWYVEDDEGGFTRVNVSSSCDQTMTEDTTFYAFYYVTAKYDFVYQDRDGSNITYSITVNLKQEEIAGYSGNGNNPNVPTYIWDTEAQTLYSGNNPIVDALTTFQNEISVYKKDIRWPNATSITDASKASAARITFSSETMTATIPATCTTTSYVFKYVIKDGGTESELTGAASVPYNKVITFNPIYKDSDTYQYVAFNGAHDGVPEISNGKHFSYWSRDAAGQKLLTTQRNFGMLMTSGNSGENNGEFIAYAQYGSSVELPAWQPYIEEATATRKMGNGSDKLNADYLTNFVSKDDLRIQNMDNVKYGILVMKSPTATTWTAAQMSSILNKLGNKTSAHVSSEANTVYKFEYSDAEHISSFNRALFTVTSNYSTMQGQKLTVMAYIKIGNEAYICDTDVDASIYVDAP